MASRCPKCKEDLTHVVSQRCEQIGGVRSTIETLRPKESRRVLVTCQDGHAYHYPCPEC